jgi:sortase A
VVRSAGTALLVAGLAVFGVAAWHLWGTGIGTARAQKALKAQLQVAFPERPSLGDPVGIIQIPRIGLDAAFVEGAEDADLALGPGHYPDSALPGQGGNVTIAGHRTTYSAPFWSLDVLVPGDRVVLSTAAGTFAYRVEWTSVVDPGAWWVAQPTDEPSLTLTTCSPRFRGTQRLVVRAVQVSGPPPSA